MQLVVQAGRDSGKVFNLDQPLLFVGRQPGSEIFLSDFQVSRRHLQLELKGSVLSILDLGSENGTRVNGQKIQSGQRRDCYPGDQVQLGATTLVLVDSTNLEAFPGLCGEPNLPGLQAALPVVETPTRRDTRLPFQNIENPLLKSGEYQSASFNKKIRSNRKVTSKKDRPAVYISKLAILLLGFVLIALYGNFLDQSNLNITNNLNNRFIEPTRTAVPTPTVRGLTGTNLPPPSPQN